MSNTVKLSDVIPIVTSKTKSVTLSFVRVNKHPQKKQDKYTYEVYSANISGKQSFQNELVDSVGQYLISIDQNKKEKVFDALTQKSDWYESVPVGFVSEYDDLVNAFGKNQITQLSDKIETSFYVLKVSVQANTVYLIRRVNGLKKLNSSGILAAIDGNQLNQISDDVIGLDSVADLVMYSDKIFVLTHSALGALFNLRTAFADSAKKIIQPLKNSQKIQNYDLLEATVVQNLGLSKMVANMANKGRNFKNPLSNEPRVLSTIKDFSLGVNYDLVTHTLIFDNPDQAVAALRLISDYYYETTQNGDMGVVDE
ncbi:Kiwa anti-phage protein KwaB-like domain-containing protein [Lacticaseibacillus paracasei]|uniref:Kiwa anti-phage protein KwaB-like domain-containing protein n=1 Tax=Lacticaseibacillus paracasei TaxID=1597 RepID=UPI000E09A92B|nr:Kiwa anti-phage protein KwaB-like domain-containing protein [Lacticaseibacillus paracasei]MDM7530951.1 DUF4868 domain-containing protein [Lacticaseibacillus paracasei]RDF91110.1 hypothetical protein DQM23_08295 [Lacticaseibacillus paracasei]